MRLIFLLFGVLVDICFAYTVDDCSTDLERNRYLKVFRDKCYRFYTKDTKSHDTAQEVCKINNGVLAMPKTKDINDFLRNHLTNTFHVTDDAWIGLDDLRRETIFVWDDNTALTWQNFGDGEGPKSSLYSNSRHFEDCVTIRPSTGTWHDYRCRDDFIIFVFLHKPFVCEYPVATTTSTTATGNVAPTTSTRCPIVECEIDCGVLDYKTDKAGCLVCQCGNN